ncbi:MAG: hypothetical protein ABJF10_11510 [Chthoniobacter sp.]|uniref:hypothetical protein n=1 Tax=Chthoniobacter sp. TaxID=2510640 RepID=UPI0032A500F2
MLTTDTNRQPVILDLPPSTLARYSEASEELEETLGLSPGPEFLMSLAVEHESPFELTSTFLGEIIEALREPIITIEPSH